VVHKWEDILKCNVKIPGSSFVCFLLDTAEDEEIDIEKCISEDSSRVSVKILRKIIPKLRIACYYSDEQVSGKRKCESSFYSLSRNFLVALLYLTL
jgi:hypothetical protein